MVWKEWKDPMGKDVLVLPWKYAGDHERIARLLERYGCRLVDRPVEYPLTEDQLVELVKDVDGLITGIEPITARVLANANRLKVISTSGVGYNHIDIDEATRRGIAVCICAGCNNRSVAELALGMMFALARRIGEADRALRRGQWQPLFGTELFGKTLGIIGLGRAGKTLGVLGRALSMRVLAYDIAWDIPFAAANGIDYVPLERLLQESDFVSIHVPLTPQTHYLINEETLSLMKPSAFLINLARGPVVKQSALVEALRAGKIAGAGLDVFEVEPLTENPFAEFENVIMTPHIGGSTEEARERTLFLAITNVCNVLNGLPPHCQVN